MSSRHGHVAKLIMRFCDPENKLPPHAFSMRLFPLYCKVVVVIPVLLITLNVPRSKLFHGEEDDQYSPNRSVFPFFIVPVRILDSNFGFGRKFVYRLFIGLISHGIK